MVRVVCCVACVRMDVGYVRAEKSSPACVGTGVYVKTAQGLMRGLPRDLCEDSGLCDNSGIEDWGLCKDWGFARTGFM